MKILVLLADGFEEIEAITVIDVLRRAGIEVDSVGLTGGWVTGSHNIKVMADKKISEVDIEKYDGIVLPGGSKGVENLLKSSKVKEFLEKANEKNKLIAAICAAPLVLAKYHILDKRRATIYPGMEKEIPYPRDEKVVVDENVITSQAPGTALLFALAIVEKLLGKEKVLEIKKQLVV
ncbi:MAG: DJ-1/PfpI family protein [Candidatus Aenigmatarchaeota archaeon]